jgi:thiamine-phosphate pyrophosphorylase
MPESSASSSSSVGRHAFSSASLYVLIDSVDYLRNGTAIGLRALVEALVAAEVDLIQLRDKRLNDRQLIDVGQQIAGSTAGTKTRLIMNDRVDLALACGADGVHLGQDDLSVADARAIIGREKIVGLSTHSLHQAREAAAEAVDYIAVGPIFPSSTKSFENFVGIGLLSAVVKEGIMPSFAIGGINASNVDQIVSTGIRRIAVSSAVAAAPNPKEAAIHLLSRLRSP